MSSELVSVADLEVISQRVARSGLFGLNAEQVFTLCLLAQSEGLHPIEAMRRFHVIQGRPAMRADAMQAQFQANGGRVEWVVSTGEECRALFYHEQYAKKGFEVRVTYAELTKAGVATTPAWKKFPRQMLRARAISEGVRAVDPGIVVGIYCPEEVSDFTPRESTPIETTARVEPQPAVREDKRRVKDRHQPPAEVVKELAAPEPEVDARPYTKVVTDACHAVNDWYRETCHEEGIKFDPPVNVFMVDNHLATSLVESGKAPASRIEGADGHRSRPKVQSLLANWHAKAPEKFTQAVREYCEAKLKEACVAHGLLFDAADEGEPEPVPAEDQTQVLEVETAGV